MFNQRIIWGNLTGLGIVILMASGGQATPRSSEHSTSNAQFRPIEQPLALKAVVTLGGLGLMGLELWWFLFSQPKTKKVESNQGVQSLDITVDGGYEPSLIVVKSGQPVRLNFLRKDPNSCLEKVLFPDFHIAQDLPLNQVTTVEFTPQISGKYSFTCGMNMFRGEIEVQ
jgi:plastocyanin domain-containing protein